MFKFQQQLQIYIPQVKITYNHEDHLNLVKKSLPFKEKNKLIYFEDPEADSRLRSYQIHLQDHLFWIKRDFAILLIEQYIKNSISFDEFEIEFSKL